MNHVTEAPLVQAERLLEKALASPTVKRQQNWLDDLRSALTRVDGILFRMSTPSEKQLLAPVDAAHRDLSPKLTRQVESLRGGVRVLSDQLNTLLVKLHGAPVNSNNMCELRSAGECLAKELRTINAAETSLVLETAMRDTGAGD